jgi:hypothetical protein
MQLDKTRIAIRERGVLDLFDLSLHVVRSYFWPLLATMALGVLPLALANQLMIGWMFADTDNDVEFPFRYVWHMTVLIMIEAPLAAVFATTYLGDALFLERPRLRTVARNVLRFFPRLLWCQVLLRGIVFAWLLALSIQPYSAFDPFLEGFAPVGLLFFNGLMRSFRPFINEVVLLERNPLLPRRNGAMTVGKRSAMLHNPSGGDLLFRWMGAAMIGSMLFLAFYGGCIFLAGVFANEWRQGPLMLQVCLPLAMWLVVGFFAVYRFLSYLDLRIRQEGWEVELRMRAEASRLKAKWI